MIPIYLQARMRIPLRSSRLHKAWVRSLDCISMTSSQASGLFLKSLDLLAKANLPGAEGKTANGMDAITFYRRGEMDKLKEYCLQDVKVTKDVFDLIRSQGYLWIPQKYQAQMIKLPIAYKEKEAPAQTRLI